MERSAVIWKVSAAVCGVNFLLFGVKLYLGLAVNSIAVYADAVNNLFDALSALLTSVCIFALLRTAGVFGERQLQKSEQLFSLLISVAVTLTGAYFAYSSLERFMYPTPVWYTPFYVAVLSGTACVKLGLYVFLRRAEKKNASPVLRLMAFDSLLDFFITAVTILTLLLSSRGTFSFDALFGLLISAVILIGAVRQLRGAAGSLLDYVPADRREALYALLREADAVPLRMEFSCGEDGVTAYAVYARLPADPDALAAEALRETGIGLVCAKAPERGR